MGRLIHADELRPGLFVEYVGEPDDVVVLDDMLKAAGLRLFTGHPGRIYDTTAVQHVQVSWVGLEDEPATYALGFGTNDDRVFPGLGLLAEAEFHSREQALRAALKGGSLRADTAPWM